MTVLIGKRAYRMSDKEYRGLLTVASEQVPFGVYAIEKKDYAELRVDRCESITQLKNLKRSYREQGYKVYVNDKRQL